MKKKYIAAGLLLLSLGACQNQLDLKPLTQIAGIENALNRGENVQATLFASYGSLMNGAFLGGRLQNYAELMSDNPDFTGISINPTDFTGQIITRNPNRFNVDIDAVWVTGYRAIRDANAVIAAVDDNLITDNTPTASRNLWKGEALAIRAIAHFELVRMFALPMSANAGANTGIPLRTKFLKEDEKLQPATVAQVYQQVVADLEAALPLLPVTNSTNRLDRVSAQAYLARVRFNQLQYAQALTASEAVITAIASRSGAALSATVTAPFRNISNAVPTGGVVLQAVVGGNPMGAFRPGANLYALQTGLNSLSELLLASTGDARSANGMFSLSGGRRFSLKWDANAANIPLIRTSEIYLIAAEAAALTNNQARAQALYDIVRGNYVSPYTPTTLTGTDLLTAIRNERRIELYQEGDRYHEIRRLQLQFAAFPNVRPAVPFNHPSTILQTPLAEISGS